MSEENVNNPENGQTPLSWEAQLQARAVELFAQRIAPLKTEIERLHSSFNEISTNLLAQAQAAPSEEDTASLLTSVKECRR